MFALKVFVLPTVFFSNTDYKDFHGCYCLAAMLTGENKSVESVISVFALKVFVLPTVFFWNTDYKDFHGCYCFEKIIR